MASSTLTANVAQPTMDRVELAAAQALLGVSPSPGSERSDPQASDVDRRQNETTVNDPAIAGSEETTAALVERDSSEEADTPKVTFQRRPRSGSFGLDALADVATLEKSSSQHISFVVSTGVSSSDSDDSETMPPPPPRRRRRSASNPEGMERWNSLGDSDGTGRRHFVLPTSILEEELAEVSAAMQEQAKRTPQQSIPEDEELVDANSPGRVSDDQEPKEDDSNLSPDELLRRARSRLLEDLLEGKVHGDKGAITLPHSLDKYKDIYNKNGRVGIYSPAERAAIIAKFHRKRSRRVWNKKIRYNCRKSLADRRLRVKGRFVKRSEQEQLAKELAQKETQGGDQKEEANVVKPDDDMPDVNDPEAGFSPTEDQPYRRLRRHTIT